MFLETQKDISSLTTFWCSLTCSHYFSCTSQEQLQETIHTNLLNNHHRYILWGGANTLFHWSHFDGLIIHIQLKHIRVIENNDMNVLLEVGAGEDRPSFVQRCVQQWYAGGIENLSLIPWTVGAAPVGNIGAYGKEVGELVEKVWCIDTHSGEFFELTKEQCRFSYRWSIFKGDLAGNAIITKVFLRLQKRHPGDPLSLAYKDIEQYLNKHDLQENQLTPKELASIISDIRASKLPDLATTGTAGSFYKNPILPITQIEKLRTQITEQYHSTLVEYQTPYRNKIKISAGQLLDLAGRKGKSHGYAGVYEKHALILVNHEKKATGGEVYDFSEKIIKDIEEKFGVSLEPEVVIV